MFMRYVRQYLASALRLPKPNPLGWLAIKVMAQRNKYLETAAVRLSRIEPHHHVLEIGFGPGIGLAAACKIVKGGEGKVYGVDYSPYAVVKASKKLRRHIQAGRLEIQQANVMKLPYHDNTFDRVFHCNCFYFWPDLITASKEIHRVMKANSLMVTTLNVNALQAAKAQGYLPNTNTDVLNYMVALESANFKNVYIHYVKYKDISYQAIYAEPTKS